MTKKIYMQQTKRETHTDRYWCLSFETRQRFIHLPHCALKKETLGTFLLSMHTCSVCASTAALLSLSRVLITVKYVCSEVIQSRIQRAGVYSCFCSIIMVMSELCYSASETSTFLLLGIYRWVIIESHRVLSVFLVIFLHTIKALSFCNRLQPYSSLLKTFILFLKKVQIQIFQHYFTLFKGSNIFFHKLPF